LLSVKQPNRYDAQAVASYRNRPCTEPKTGRQEESHAAPLRTRGTSYQTVS